MNEEINSVITENEKLVYKIASKYSNYYNIDDLYQSGCIGIIKAYKNYDMSSNTKFSSYAYKYILGEIIDFIRKDKNIIVSEETYTLYKKYLKIKEMLSKKYQKEISFSEVCAYMNIDEYYMLSIIESINIDKNINDKINYNNISDNNHLEEKIILNNEIDSLNDYDKSLINYRYYMGFSQKETAELLGTNQVSISRSEKLILNRIKNNISS